MGNNHQDVPALLAPMRIAPVSSRRVIGAFGIAALLACGVGFGLTHRPTPAAPAPYTQADLGPNLVTPIDPADPVAMARALSQLRLADGERQRFSAGLDGGRMRLGLMAFYDDEDPDGDAIEVRGAGFSQRVPLGAGITLVVVPYATGSPIEVTAVADGGDIATAAMMTKFGPTHIKRLFLGETLGVATP